EPMQDETNSATEYERNRVRHELMPLLRSFNPRVDEAIVRLADSTRTDIDLLDALSSAGIERDEDGTSVSVAIDASASSATLARRMRSAVRLLLGDVEGFGESHYASTARLVVEGQTGDRVDLPRGVVAERGRGVVRLTKAAFPSVALPESPVRLSVPGEASF